MVAGGFTKVSHSSSPWRCACIRSKVRPVSRWRARVVNLQRHLWCMLASQLGTTHVQLRDAPLNNHSSLATPMVCISLYCVSPAQLTAHLFAG